MSATYSDTAQTPRDKARELLGDTTFTAPEDALLTDEHILAVLAAQGTFELGVAWLADELLGRFALEPLRTTLDDGTSVDMSGWLPIWRDLAARLRAGALIDQGSITPTSAAPRIGCIRAGVGYVVR